MTASGLRSETEQDMTHYCLLLPLVPKNAPFEKFYAIVFSDWDVMVGRHSSTKMSPRLPSVLFGTDILG
jgi:hypothetical protein